MNAQNKFKRKTQSMQIWGLSREFYLQTLFLPELALARTSFCVSPLCYKMLSTSRELNFFLKADNYIIVLRILYVTCTITKNRWSLISLFVVSLDMNAQLLEINDNTGKMSMWYSFHCVLQCRKESWKCECQLTQIASCFPKSNIIEKASRLVISYS